ncbi:MAG TPA: hypothetical protein ENN39_11700 [Desulfonatronum sp.]|nr:hypothetical protein [Desulfonatronum sp.]
MAKSRKKSSFEQDSKAVLETVLSSDAKARLKREMSLTQESQLGAGGDVLPFPGEKPGVAASRGTGATAGAEKAAAKPATRKSASKGRMTVAELDKRTREFMDQARQFEKQQLELSADLTRELSQMRSGLQGVEGSVQSVLARLDADQQQLQRLFETTASMQEQLQQTAGVLSEKPWEAAHQSVQILVQELSERMQRLESSFATDVEQDVPAASPALLFRDSAQAGSADARASAEYWLDQAKAFWSGQRYSDPQAALACLDKAAALEPANAQCFNERGLAKSDAGSLREAVADFTRAVELAPSMAAAYHNRGLVFAKMNLADRACRDFQQAASLGDDRAWRKACESGYCGGSFFKKFLRGIID